LRNIVLIKQFRSIVINYLEEFCIYTSNSLAYIYFSYEDRENNSAADILGSLLRQLIEKKGVAPDQLMALYSNYSRRKEGLKLTDITKLLLSECLGGHRTFIVIDALDECSVYNDTKELFIDELYKLLPSTQLMLTSRPDAAIIHKITDALKLEIRATDADIANYVDRRLEEDVRLKRHVEGDAELKVAIASRIVQNARGQYVPPRLQ